MQQRVAQEFAALTTQLNQQLVNVRGLWKPQPPYSQKGKKLAATTPTIAELRTALGIGSLYSDTVVDEVCQSAQDIVFSYLWDNALNNSGHSNTTNTGTLYFDQSIYGIFYVGQTVTITGNGSKHNGSKTLTGVGERTITYAITGNNNTAAPFHPVNPYGKVSAESYVDYSAVAAVNEAALMIAIDIWQARQASNAGGISPDFQPSPYRMGNTLTARVRGLLAPYLSPNSLVG